MSGCGGMADAQDSKSCGGDLVWVQVPPSALNENPGSLTIRISGFFALIHVGNYDKIITRRQKIRKRRVWYVL